MALLQTVTDALQYPAIALLVVLVIRAGLAYQSELTWPEYKTLHGCKRFLFPLLDKAEPFGYRWFVIDKDGRDHPDYLLTLEAPPTTVLKSLSKGAGDLHLISSMKRRPGDDGDTLHSGDVVWRHTDGRQTHAYVFENSDGGTDVFSHEEPSVTDPLNHLDPDQNPGDPRGVVTDALE